jgi:FHA domain-containing protein
MATCPSGHNSASDDFCDVCGVLIGAAPELAIDGGQAAGGVPDGAQSAGPAAGRSAPPAEPCPRCGVTRAGQFCEACGYDFAAAWAPPPPAPGPSVPTSLGPAPVPPVPAGTGAVSPGTAAPETVVPCDAGSADTGSADTGSADTGHWAVVVTADRAYFDTVQAAGGPDAGTIAFPAYYPQRQFPLSGTEMRIGRRSVSSGITPEIDLSLPPADPGVSRLHAVLLRSPDGTWAVVDPGSANGTLVNGSEIPEGQVIPVHPGDLIHVGAWTAISVVTEP